MNYKIFDKNSTEEVASLFTSVFSSSEGEKEGELIGNLASELSSRADNQEIICIGAYEEETIIGVIFFTRLRGCPKTTFRLKIHNYSICIGFGYQ